MSLDIYSGGFLLSWHYSICLGFETLYDNCASSRRFLSFCLKYSTGCTGTSIPDKNSSSDFGIYSTSISNGDIPKPSVIAEVQVKSAAGKTLMIGAVELKVIINYLINYLGCTISLWMTAKLHLQLD